MPSDPVFAGIFYMGAALLMASLGLCFYVAHNFRTNNFPYVWPIKSLRFFVSVSGPSEHALVCKLSRTR